MTTALTLAALQMAMQQCQPEPGLVYHSDQGRQCTVRAYQAMLQEHHIQASMNGVGTWYDDAPMASFWDSLKSELVPRRLYGTHAVRRLYLFLHSETFNTLRRRQSSLGYFSPEAYEQLYHRQSASA